MILHYDISLKSPFIPKIINLQKTDLIDAEELENEYSEKEDEKNKREHVFICKTCKNFVTNRKSITEINGDFIHLFQNPAGIYYRIGLFANAKGCKTFGESTADFTWFPGFAWNYAICSSCFTHLGWFYQSGDNNFFGLIMDHLIEEGE